MAQGSLLQVQNLSKAYGTVRALDDVTLAIESGEIHAVLGENGAGKSTLVGVFSGFVLPDSGTVSLDKKDVPLGNPAKIKRLGIEMVHQHFTLAPAFTVEENLRLFSLSEGKRSGPEKAFALAEELGWKVDPSATVRTLPVGTQQRIEILKALATDARILILDEPTAVLSPEEIDDLFEVLRKLKSRGKTIILIAHKLSEVMRVAGRASVLRKGKLIATACMKDVDEKTLAEWMVGGLPETPQKSNQEVGVVGLEVRNLWVRGRRSEESVRGVSFSLSQGEILGIGGVDGNGQTELVEALAQVRPAVKGEILWKGEEIGSKRLGYIPQDRQSDGLALTMSVIDNMLIVGHRSASLRFGPFLRTSRITSWAKQLVAQFRIAVRSPADPVGMLSGGNQQKVVVARTLESHPDLIVAANPTRGLDLQATNYVHRQIMDAKAGGAAIVLVSADIDELALLADRTVFMSSGHFTAG